MSGQRLSVSFKESLQRTTQMQESKVVKDLCSEKRNHIKLNTLRLDNLGK